jgi:transcriptional regulator with XRE-family HTH domain
MRVVSQKDLQRFGARVRAERERIGISQEELAGRARLHRTYLGGVERGERNVGLLNLFRIADALGVGPGELLDGVADVPPVNERGRSKSRKTAK